MSNGRIINTFLALFSQNIEEIEKSKKKGEIPVKIKVIDILPSKEERELLEDNILNLLAEQGWQVRGFDIQLEKPAIINISFNLYM